jgi:hypothetical protein
MDGEAESGFGYRAGHRPSVCHLDRMENHVARILVELVAPVTEATTTRSS